MCNSKPIENVRKNNNNKTIHQHKHERKNSTISKPRGKSLKPLHCCYHLLLVRFSSITLPPAITFLHHVIFEMSVCHQRKLIDD